ncbi:MAG TPA: hypothetical protein VE713_02805 [Pyrinomonadaceae bacterium]|nr:hypothetical protein [Pyrinomonadaceae bacterium]
MRIVLLLLGLLVASAGGVIAYRALFVEPHAAVVITERSVRELPDVARVVAGLVLLVAGAGAAFFAALRRR